VSVGIQNGGDELGNVFVMREKFLERAREDKEELENRKQ